VAELKTTAMTETTELVLLARKVFLPVFREVVREEAAAIGKIPPLPNDPEQVMTAAQGAEFLQVSLPTFRSWDRQGLVQRRLIGSKVRYLKSELIASLQKPEVKRTARRKSRATPPPAG